MSAVGLDSEFVCAVAMCLLGSVEIGEITKPFAGTVTKIFDSRSSSLSTGATGKLFSPSLSDILRSGVGIDSNPLTAGGVRTLALLLLWFAIRWPMLNGVEAVDAFLEPNGGAASPADAGVKGVVFGVWHWSANKSNSCGASGASADAG